MQLQPLQPQLAQLIPAAAMPNAAAVTLIAATAMFTAAVAMPIAAAAILFAAAAMLTAAVAMQIAVAATPIAAAAMLIASVAVAIVLYYGFYVAHAGHQKVGVCLHVRARTLPPLDHAPIRQHRCPAPSPAHHC